VDQNRFQEAQQHYEAGEYRQAAKGFLAAAGRGPEGTGVAYHMAGNSLMRLRRFQDAVTVYGHALRDPLYDRRGAIFANLGKAYCEIGDYAEAVKAYESALEEPDYTTKYKAYQGMADALFSRERIEDAAVAYRKAALDPENPDPGKALVNLGLCFMGLQRPADAVEAYRAALGFDDYKGRGKALANLGIAFVALQEYDDAIRSFEKATEMHGHRLSAAAQSAYSIALARVQGRQPERPTAQPEEVATQPEPEPQPEPEAAVTPQPEPPVAGGVELVEPRESLTAEFDNVWATSDFAGTTMNWDAVDDDGGPLPDFTETLTPQVTQPLAPFDHGADSLGFGDEKAVEDFFSATDAELKARDKEARRAARHERGPIAIIKQVVIAVVILGVVIGALAGGYSLGYGWPTQAQTVGGMLSAYQNGGPVDSFWVAAPTKDITKEMAKMPPVKSFTIDNVSQGATVSKASVTITPKTGAALHYTITLSREGVGWKVSGVDNDWGSTVG
jgi:tetratricopeptide (TPR) repeat protein